MAASSSSSSGAAAKKYDVFISFRGEDTRHNFTSHLYHALCRYSIRAYTDRELNKGDDISPSLIQAIQESYGSLIIFSKNYASSKWCLNELLKILECRRYGHFVIPVFYDIDPSEVRKQNAAYGEAFAKHEQNSKNKAMMETWKAALAEAANIAGWDSQSRNHRDESELILNIVNDIVQKLDHIYQLSESGLVGIDKRCEHIKALLQEFSIIGIWGMGGIGKTTLARAVYDKLCSQYDGSCFIENIREESQRRGLNQLRRELLRELLKGDFISISLQEGSKHNMRRLSHMKVFIILDDVSNFEQLEYLTQECKSLKSKSRVIITTRDKHLLTSLRAKHEIYEVKRLDAEESLVLFRLKAFSEHIPEKEYEEITKKIVSYTQGTPIALKILGLFLYSKSIKEWESTWQRLKKFPDKDIEKVLRLSFDGLNHVDQQIFLDVACFLKGENIKEVISLLDSFGFDSAIGIRTLQDKALITISNDNTVQMHDLIQEMGRQIVREESIQEPRRRSRLWDPEEVYNVLKYNKGTDKVEGIILDKSQIKDLHLSVDSFKKMINLRYLNIYSSNFMKLGKIHIAANTLLFSSKLRYLRWHEYPLRSLSSSFCAENLMELSMPFSNMKKLWNGVQDLQNLKSLNLSGSKMLVELPDFSKASKLKSVELRDCTNLSHIHPSILSLDTLETLDVSWCKKLRSLQSEVHLKSLKELCFLECPNLKEFSLSSEKLKDLCILGTAVEILHPSIGLCENLETLILSDSLKNIPSDLSRLKSLKSLQIFGCTELDTQNLHIILGGLLSLRDIRLRDCLNLSHLPDNIKHLSYLTSLKIENCGELLYISELPASIETMWLINCTSLETIIPPKSVKNKESCYLLANCVKLDEHSLCSIMEHAYTRIKQVATGALCENASTDEDFSESYIFFPGNRVPSWFGHHAAQNWISIEIPPHSYLLAFAFYCILSLEVLPYEGESLQGCGCYCYVENSESTICEGYEFYFSFPDEFYTELISDHVCIWYDRCACSDLFDEMEKQKAQGKRTKRLYFEFYVETVEEIGDETESVRIEDAIKECGVLPIYASKYDNSINDLELRLEFKLGYRTDDIDDRVELQFGELGPSTSATRFASSGFDQRGQGISSENARQDLTEINSLCLFNRFNESNCFPSQMELNLEFGFGDKSKRFQDIDDHQPLQRKKFKRCRDIVELLRGASTSGNGVGCSEFALQPLPQTNTMNKFVFQPPPTDISMQKTWLDSTQMNSTDLLDWFSEFDNSIMQFGQTGFCPDLNEIPIGGNSFDTDQPSPSLSLQLNQEDLQMSPFDVGNNSGLYTSSSSASLPDIVQMAQVFYTNIGLNLNLFSEMDSNITQFGQNRFCPDLNEMSIGGNSLDTDQQCSNLSPQLNQGYPQMNSFDSLYASSSSSSLLDIVQMAQADNVFGSPSFYLNQEDPQMNLLKGIEEGRSRQEHYHEQQQLVTGNEISCGCFIGLLLKPLWKLYSTL